VQHLFFASCLFRFASVKSALTTLSAIQQKYPSADVGPEYDENLIAEEMVTPVV